MQLTNNRSRNTPLQSGGHSKKKAQGVVGRFFDKTCDALGSDDRVEIRGFCSIYVKEYKAYTGRNPKTGEPLKVTPKKLPFFKCGKELKESVDYRQT